MAKAKKDQAPKPGESVVITNGVRKVIKHTAKPNTDEGEQ